MEEIKKGVLCGFCGEEFCNVPQSKSKYACTAWDGTGNQRRNLIEGEKCLIMNTSKESDCPYRYKMTPSNKEFTR
jgi:hypothetical protein